MISAAEYVKRLNTVNNSAVLEGFVDDIVVSDTNTLVDEKIDEFTHGVMPDGKRIGVYRNAEYALFKQHINPLAGGYVDLMLMRNFVNGLHLDKLFKRAYIFNSTDRKTNNLIGKYGIGILGINQQYWLNRQKEVYRIPFVQMIKNKAKIG